MRWTRRELTHNESQRLSRTQFSRVACGHFERSEESPNEKRIPAPRFLAPLGMTVWLLNGASRHAVPAHRGYPSVDDARADPRGHSKRLHPWRRAARAG